MPREKKKKGKGMKGMSIKSGDKRPTKQGAGLTAKGVAKYRRQNPGSKLQTAVTENKKYDLNDIVGRPTGQGYGKARTGPQTKGPIEAVSDVEYPQGEPFDIEK